MSVSGFALSKCLQSSFVVSHLFSWHVRVMERTCQFLYYLPPLRTWVLLMVLFLNLMVQDTAPQRWRKNQRNLLTDRSSCKTRPRSKMASRCFLKQWPPRRLRLRVLNGLLGVLWLALPLWKQVQPLALAAPTRQDLGVLGHRDGSTATGSLGKT